MTKQSGREEERTETVLMTVVAKEGRPSLAAAAEQLGLAAADIDADYGVVALDLVQGHYAVRVRRDRISPDSFVADRGPYSDPPVSTFGPRIKK